MTAAEREAALKQVLYPPSPMLNEQKHKTIRIPGQPAQKIYYEEYGNPKGELVFVLHGGPGYGTSTSYHQYFDPKFYHIVLFDQRNAKRSLPPANHETLTHCTPEQMMEDINRLAEQGFGVRFDKGEKIHLMGGSWGATLGLYYAAHYPERLHSLTLRATWLGMATDVGKTHGFDENGEPLLKRRVDPSDWPRCKVEWDKFIGFLHEQRNYISEDLAKDPTHAYHRLLTGPDIPDAVRKAAAFRYIMFEHVVGDVEHTPEWVAKDVNNSLTPDEQVSYATIENNLEVALTSGMPGFYAKKGNLDFNFFTDGEVRKHGKKLQPMEQLAAVPLIRIVHGQQDNVCAMQNTDVLETGIKNIMRQLGRTPDQIKKALRVERPLYSGHMLGDLGISTAMIGFTNEIRDIRQTEQAISAISAAKSLGRAAPDYHGVRPR